MMDKALSEACWSWTGKVMEKIVFNMTTVFPYEARLVNPDEWNSDGK